MAARGTDRGATWWTRAAAGLRGEAETIGFRWKPIVLVSIFALALMIPYYQKGEWYDALLAQWLGNDGAAACKRYGITFTFALRMITPFAAALVLHQNPLAYGIGPGDWRKGIRLMAIFYLVYIPCFILLLNNEGFREYYGRSVSRYDGWAEFFAREVAIVATVMIAGEFFFRGFLMLGSAQYLGPLAALLLHVLPYVYAHRGKAEIEALGSLPVGLALGYLALTTRSVWYGILLHGTIALGFNVAIFALS